MTAAVTAVRPSLARSRRLRHVAVAAVLVLASGASLLFLRTRGPASRLDADLLAVAPFDVLDPKLQLWREGLVDLLARNLDGAGRLRTVAPTNVIRRWTGRADQPSAAELGRRTGAGLTLVGSLVPSGGDSVRLQARLFEAATVKPLADLELRGASARLDRLSDSLTVRLLAELGRIRRVELTRVASLGSSSMPAMKAFLEGEQWFRRTAWDSALASYERAVALDSSFTLALWRLGRVVAWKRAGGDSLAVALSLRAGALNRGLAPRDSLLVAIDSLREKRRAVDLGGIPARVEARQRGRASLSRRQRCVAHARRSASSSGHLPRRHHGRNAR